MGSSQNWTILLGNFYTFRAFLKVKAQNWDIFWVAKFQIFFLGMPDIPDVFLCKQMLGASLRIKKSLECPPWVCENRGKYSGGLYNRLPSELTISCTSITAESWAKIWYQ